VNIPFLLSRPVLNSGIEVEGLGRVREDLVGELVGYLLDEQLGCDVRGPRDGRQRHHLAKGQGRGHSFRFGRLRCRIARGPAAGLLEFELHLGEGNGSANGSGNGGRWLEDRNTREREKAGKETAFSESPELPEEDYSVRIQVSSATKTAEEEEGKENEIPQQGTMASPREADEKESEVEGEVADTDHNYLGTELRNAGPPSARDFLRPALEPPHGSHGLPRVATLRPAGHCSELAHACNALLSTRPDKLSTS